MDAITAAIEVAQAAEQLEGSDYGTYQRAWNKLVAAVRRWKASATTLGSLPLIYQGVFVIPAHPRPTETEIRHTLDTKGHEPIAVIDAGQAGLVILGRRK